MNGLKVYFEDGSDYTIDNTGDTFEIGVYQEFPGVNNLNVQKIYNSTPAMLVLKGIVKDNFEGKRIVRVEWLLDNLLINLYEGNIQTTYNIQYNGKIEERLNFLLLPPT